MPPRKIPTALPPLKTVESPADPSPVSPTPPQFLTKEPKTSPPKAQTASTEAAAAPVVVDKTAILKRATLQLNRISEKYNMIFDEYKIASTVNPEELKVATMTLTRLIDASVKGNVPTTKEMDAWGEKTKGVDVSIGPPFLLWHSWLRHCFLVILSSLPTSCLSLI